MPMGLAYPLTPRFLWECLSSQDVSPFPALDPTGFKSVAGYTSWEQTDIAKYRHQAKRQRPTCRTAQEQTGASLSEPYHLIGGHAAEKPGKRHKEHRHERKYSRR